MNSDLGVFWVHIGWIMWSTGIEARKDESQTGKMARVDTAIGGEVADKLGTLAATPPAVYALFPTARQLKRRNKQRQRAAP